VEQIQHQPRKREQEQQQQKEQEDWGRDRSRGKFSELNAYRAHALRGFMLKTVQIPVPQLHREKLILKKIF